MSAPGGHPDFYFLGTKAAGQALPRPFVSPIRAGRAKGNDSTARCWDIAAPDLVNGKPVYNSARANNTCACQFSEWDLGNSSHIPGGYTQADSPLSAGCITAGPRTQRDQSFRQCDRNRHRLYRKLARGADLEGNGAHREGREQLQAMVQRRQHGEQDLHGRP